MASGVSTGSPTRATRDRVTGRSVGRKEDRPLLRGEARFVDDLRRPDALHAALLRSPVGHARIAAIDTTAARALDGVHAVVTAADLPERGVRIPMRMFKRDGMERFLQPVIADQRVRYSGEPVALVVADSRYVAEDAAELIGVEYEPLPVLTDPEAAREPGAPALHPDPGTNVAADFTIASGEIEEAIAAADLVVRERIRCQRHAAVPLETRGLLAEVDPTGRLTVWGAAKVVHINRRILASLLGWPLDRVRLVEVDVGGGFGARGEFYPEDFLIPWCAIQLQRPVAWTEDREENLRSCNHSREQIHEIALALSSEGIFLGLDDHVVNDTGAYVRTHGSVVPGMTAGLLPGPYNFGAYRCRIEQVVTNKTPAGTYRAPGRYEANLARERIIDIAARRLEMDPVELRRRNLIEAAEMPYATGASTDGHPVVYDSGDYPRLLEEGLESFGFEEMSRWRAGAPAGRRRGVGLAYFVEKSGIGVWEYARVTITAEGVPVVHTGTASLGQGMETVLAQICADSLGVEYAAIRVEHGDTESVPDGMGSFGSRATALGGAAVKQAATQLRERLRALAAAALERPAEAVEVAGDRVADRDDPERFITLGELSARAATADALGRGERPGLSEEAYVSSEGMSFPYGLHCAAVEVDTVTGAIEIARYGVAYDVGVAINPQLIDGQIVGGMAQGLGGAIFEEMTYDDGGQLTAGSFMDYLIPTAVEVPEVRVHVTENAPSPLTPLGAKGAGEAGTAAAGAVLANAVSDALGAEALELPLTPERVAALADRGSAA